MTNFRAKIANLLSARKSATTTTGTDGNGGGGDDPPKAGDIAQAALTTISPLLGMGAMALRGKFNQKQQQQDPPEEEIEIADSMGLKSGKYSKKRIQQAIGAAKSLGVDPMQMLALHLQEDGFMKGYKQNDRRNRAVGGVANYKFSDEEGQMLNQLQEQTKLPYGYLASALILKNKLNMAKGLGYTDEAKQLQAYNGYGLLTKEAVGGDKAYGIPIGDGIDMKANPLYGKRLVQLKKDLMKNKDLLSLIGQ